QRQASATQRAADDSVRRQAEKLQQLTAENERLGKQAQATSSASDGAELARLRAQASALSQQASSLADLRRENRRLQAAASQARTPLQASEESMVKGSFAKNWVF